MGEVVNVIKAAGEVEPFSEEKVTSSLLRVGAERKLASEIVAQIKPRLYQNIPTFEIYSKVMSLLRERKKDLAEKYNLKKAIMDLGPTGYPFEKFIAGILKEVGHKVETNKIVLGKCVAHEVDIIAQNKERYMIECKFHSIPGGRTDIKVALYTYARFLDIIERTKFDMPWLITNTKVTQEVETYASCVGMRVTAWDYPVGESLNEMIDESGLYPTTAITSLSEKRKRELLEKGIVFSRDFVCSK